MAELKENERLATCFAGHTASMRRSQTRLSRPADDKSRTAVYPDHPSRWCPPFVAGIGWANMAALQQGAVTAAIFAEKGR